MYAAIALAVATMVGRAGAAASGEELMQVLAPAAKRDASAHPHVNVVVLFGVTPDGVAADPFTFRARMNGVDVTDRFEPLTGELGGATGLRATLGPEAVRDDASNRLRLRVRSKPVTRSERTRRLKDKDRVRFGATPRENQPPIALLAADRTAIVPGEPIAFDAGGSSDPELDVLTYAWDFGDGTTATGRTASHAYAETDAPARTVSLTVSDGRDAATASMPLVVQPDVDPDRTRGVLRVEADGPLDFGGVAAGAVATRTLRVVNADATATSQLVVRASVAGDAFAIEPAMLELGPSETGMLTVRFAPTAPGHAHGTLSLVASASGRASASVLAHGFGGEAPGSGPTLAARTAYYAVAGSDVYTVNAVRPDGTRHTADTTVHACDVPGGGDGTGDACLSDADCAPHGGTCDTSVSMLLAPEDLCADPEGNLVMLSVDNAITDPDPDATTERTGVLMHVAVDAGGAAIAKSLLARTTSGTTTLACDERGAGGRAYLAEYFDVDSDECDRTEREELNAIRKDGTGTTRLESRLDAILGIDGCNDIEDTSRGLATAGAGEPLYVAFDSAGIWRYAPRRQFLTNVRDGKPIAVHPDGALVHATAVDAGASTTINLYKVSSSRVEGGPLSLPALAPCASFAVPTNDGAGAVRAVAVAPAAGDPSQAVALVTFVVGHEAVADVLPPSLAVQGTVAFDVPRGDGDACHVAGLVTLEPLDLLSF